MKNERGLLVLEYLRFVILAPVFMIAVLITIFIILLLVVEDSLSAFLRSMVKERAD